MGLFVCLFFSVLLSFSLSVLIDYSNKSWPLAFVDVLLHGKKKTPNCTFICIWRVSSQNVLYPFWSNLRYLRFKLLKYKENNKKICNTFDHNFKNIPLYIMSNVSLERYYFVLYDGALTLKMSKMALNAFCDKTLHIYQGKKKKNLHNPVDSLLWNTNKFMSQCAMYWL